VSGISRSGEARSGDGQPRGNGRFLTDHGWMHRVLNRNVCPTNVFDAVPGEAPIIARQDACQIDFMCQVHCQADALYVAPDADYASGVSEEWVAAQGLFGCHRREIGWTRETRELRRNDGAYRGLRAVAGQEAR
jgi:hypothetical protein